MVPLEVITFDNFANCEAELRSLNERTQNKNPFLNIDWLKLWWEHFYGTKSLHIILFRKGNEAIGFAPFYRVTTPVLGMPEFRLLGDGYSSYLDMVCLAGYEEPLMDALFTYFKAIQPAAVVQFNDINDRFSRFFEPLFRKVSGEIHPASFFKLYPCPLANMQGGWDSFYKTQRNSDSRYKLRKVERRLVKFGELRFREVIDPADLARLFPKLEHIHRTRFRETENLLFKGEKLLFLQAALKQMSKLPVTLFITELDRVPLAFLIGFKMGDVFIAHNQAFDPAFSLLFLGQIQLRQIMERKSGEGFQYFDFSKGGGVYKWKWSNDETTNYLFRYGFNLNIIGYLYYRILNAFLNLKLYLREKGYNVRIKKWIARIRQGNIFKSKEREVKIEDITDLTNINLSNLSPWSYSIIQNLPTEVRTSIIETIIKAKHDISKIDNSSDLREIMLVFGDGNYAYRLRY